MYSYLKGTIANLSPSQAVLDVNGLGYELQITLNTFEALQKKEQALLYTHLQIRDDAWVLYGFFTELEKATFQRLLTISGVGAATARILLSSLTPVELNTIIANEDAKGLQQVKGIGSKTAQRIILELKGKLPDMGDGELSASSHNTIEQDALHALMGLGIAKSAAEAALKKTKNLPGEEATVEERIKIALKNL